MRWPRGSGPARRATRLLLLHAHAVCLGSLRRLLRAACRPAHPGAHAGRGRRPPALGPAHRRRRASLSWRSRASSPTASGAATGARPTSSTRRWTWPASALEEKPGDHYLVVSALTPYKRVDIAVETASGSAGACVVVGTGPEEGAAAGPRRPHRPVPRLEGRRLRWRSSTLRCRALLPPPWRISASRRWRPWPPAVPSSRWGRGRAGDGGAAGRAGAAHRAPLLAPDGGRPGGGGAALRVRTSPCSILQGPAPPCRALRPAELQGARGGLSGSGAREGARVLKSYSRVLEQLMLAGTSSWWWAAGCSRMSRASTSSVPPASPWTFPRWAPISSAIVPIVVAWGISFQRLRSLPAAPHRLATLRGGRRGEGVLAGGPRPGDHHDLPLPRVPILARGHRLLLALSPSPPSPSPATSSGRGFASRAGAATTSATAWRWDRADLAQHVIERLRGADSTSASRWWGGGRRQGQSRRVPCLRRLRRSLRGCWRPGRWITSSSRWPTRTRAGCQRLLDAIGDEPVTIHVVPDLFRFITLRGWGGGVRGHPPSSTSGNRRRTAGTRWPSASSMCSSPPRCWSRCRRSSRGAGGGGAAHLPGPVLFRQDRMGLDGQSFRMPSSDHAAVDADVASGLVWPTLAIRGARPSAPFSGASASTEPAPVRQRAARRDERGGPAPERPVSSSASARPCPGTCATRCGPVSPAQARRSTACGGTPRSRSGSSSTSSTSSSRSSGSISGSSPPPVTPGALRTERLLSGSAAAGFRSSAWRRGESGASSASTDPSPSGPSAKYSLRRARSSSETRSATSTQKSPLAASTDQAEAALLAHHWAPARDLHQPDSGNATVTAPGKMTVTPWLRAS